MLKKKKVCFNGLCACVCGGEKRAEKVCCSMFFHQQEGSLKNAPKKKSTECRTGILTEERKLQQKPTTFWGEFSRQKFISLDSDLKQF